LGFLTHFLYGCIGSFLGTLPMGTINVSIAEESIRRGIRAGIIMAFGACFVEFFQAYIALSFFNILSTNPEVERTIILTCIPIFLVIGFYYFFKQNTTKPPAPSKVANVIGFAKGIMVTTLNLIAIPYYVFLGGYLHSAGLIRLEPEFIAAFSVGVVGGTFLVFLIYAKLGQYIRRKSEKLSHYASKLVGLIFIAIAISQAFRYYW
jgi:threonine/homoserine/homoserine lactone efflux protein